MSEVTYKVKQLKRVSTPDQSNVVTEITIEATCADWSGPLIFSQSLTYDPNSFSSYESLSEGDVVSWINTELLEKSGTFEMMKNKISFVLEQMKNVEEQETVHIVVEDVTNPFAANETVAENVAPSNEEAAESGDTTSTDTTSTDTTSTDTTSTDTTSTGGGE
jgi:hypothetical protein